MVDDSLHRMWEETLGGPPGELSAATTFRRPPLGGGGALAGGDRFELGEEVGRGGMGIVLRARQRSLDRDVAVKLLRRSLDDDSDGSRSFLAEALTNGLLEHPNIVPVYDLGRSADGELFLAMKLVGGSSWSELIASKRRPLVDELHVLSQVCNAVSYAHSRGVTHNDLKPSNVMIGEFGEVLVMDWGLASSFGAREEGSLLCHRDEIHGPCGTPHYMAPELAEGRGRDIGPWTDVYLLGGILYKLLTGRPPHSASNALEALVRAVSHEIEPLDASIPVELRALCERALDADPGQRHPSVQAFQQELETFLRHRESLQISSRAELQLSACTAQDGAALDEAGRNKLYTTYAAAVAGFTSARSLWPGNPRAIRGVGRARRAFARAALERGDLGLAGAQLGELEEEDAGLRDALHAARQQRAAETRSRRRMRRLLVGLALLLGTVLAAGWGLTSAQARRIAEQNSALRDSEWRLSQKLEELQRTKDESDARGRVAIAALDELTELPLAWSRQADPLTRHLAEKALAEAGRGWAALAASGALHDRIGAARASLRLAQVRLRVERDATGAQALLHELLETLPDGPDSAAVALRLEAHQELARCRLQLGQLDGFLAATAAERALSSATPDLVGPALRERFAPLLDARPLTGGAADSLRAALFALVDEAVAAPPADVDREVELLSALGFLLLEVEPARAHTVLARNLERAGEAVGHELGGERRGRWIEALGLAVNVPQLVERCWEELAAYGSRLLDEPQADARSATTGRLRMLGFIHAEHGRWEEARRYLEAHLARLLPAALDDPGHADLQASLAVAQADLAKAERTLGRSIAALDLCRSSLAIFERLAAAEPDDVVIANNRATVLEELGRCQAAIGRAPEAVAAFRSCLALLEETAARLPELSADRQDRLRASGSVASSVLSLATDSASGRYRRARVATLLAEGLTTLGDLEAARGAHRRSIELRRELLRESEDPDHARRLAMALDQLGHVLHDHANELGDPALHADALPIYRESYALFLRLFHARPDADIADKVAHAAGHVTELLGIQGDDAGVQEVAAQVVPVARALVRLRPDDPVARSRLAGHLEDLARSSAARGEQARAAGAFEEAIALRESLAEREPPALFSALWQRARFRASHGDLSGGRADYERALAVIESRFAGSTPPPQAIVGLVELSRELCACLLAAGEADVASALAEHANDRLDQLDAPALALGTAVQREAAVARLLLGELEEARRRVGWAQSIAPHEAANHLLRALLERATGDPDAALAAAARAFEEEPGPDQALWLTALSGDPGVLALLPELDGWRAVLAAHLAGDASLAAVREATARAPHEAERRRRRCLAEAVLGLAAEVRGEEARAREHYRAAELSLAFDSPAAVWTVLRRGR